MNPLTAAITINEPIKTISTVLRTVHIARNSIIKSTISCDNVVKGLTVLCPHIRSLTKPVHVASQKPMKKSRCKMNRTSNFMILAFDVYNYSFDKLNCATTSYLCRSRSRNQPRGVGCCR